MSFRVFPIDFASYSYDDYIDLRSRILRVPINLSFSEQELSDEADMFHFAAYSESKIVACFVLVDLGNGVIKMRQVAVDESYQNQGIGSLMVQYCEAWCKIKAYQKIVLNARLTAVRFYEKNNYTKIGKAFEEVGIPHFKMEKSLTD